MSDHNAGAPAWDIERAKWLVGKQVLVGITHLAADGKSVANKERFHGMIMAAVEGEGITIVCLSGPNEGDTVTLPPVTSAYMDLKPGTYRLRATGEAIENPDVSISWTVKQAGLSS